MKEARKHKRVFICSPFRPRGESLRDRADDLRHNKELAVIACKYAVEQGFMPIAPHLYFPQFLSDNKPEERSIGTCFGLDLLRDCDELWIIGKRVSEGMKQEIIAADALGIPVNHITLCLELTGEVLDMLGKKSRLNASRYENENNSRDEDDEEEGMLYDGD